MRRTGLAMLLAGAVAWLAYRRRSLTRDGAVAATAVGAVVFQRMGLSGAGALLAFFISSSALSRTRARARTTGGVIAQAKGAQRDALQVLANGGVAAICALVGSPGGLLGALGAAAADTWATEIGMRCGGRPRLVTTLRPVEAGRSGGVTGTGMLASVGGAVVVGLGWRACGGAPPGLRTAAMAGVAGALVDSVLGATAQALYRCARCGGLVESPAGHQAEIVHGYHWMDNDVVNALATLAGAVLGGVVWPARRTRRSR